MPAVKQYSRINFENVPSHNTPLNATNLNKMDKGIDKLDDLLVTVRNNIETLQSNATTDEANVLALQGETREINDNLNGFKFYPTGTGIVGLIADDSAYTDADGNYVVWGTPTAEQLVADNPNTYKSVPSTKETHGEVGADTAIPFSGGLKNICIVCSGYAGASAYCTLIDSNGNSNLTTSVSVSSDDTFNVVWDTPTGMYRYRVYAKKAGKYRVINNISTGRTDNIVNASVGQLLATVNGAAYSEYYPIWGIATIQYL